MPCYYSINLFYSRSIQGRRLGKSVALIQIIGRLDNFSFGA